MCVLSETIKRQSCIFWQISRNFDGLKYRLSMRKRIFLKALAGGGTALLGPRLQAAEAEPAPGPVILTVRGKVRGGTVDFDARKLEALGAAAIRTKTQWLSAPVDWTGVPLAKVLASVGATGETLRMRALNDYSVTIPVADIGQFNPILARRLNGKALTVRDRGPLIVIYPYDSFSQLESQLYYDRAIWQLREIVVE
jgi:hypothetical protein